MAEHSRSSGVFSRRLAVVNGGCCRPPARPRRYPVQSSLRRDPHTGVCVQVWCIAKKIGANRAPSPARRVCSGNDDLAFSLLSLCPPKVVVGASLVKGPGMHLANFFFAQPSALFVAAPTTTTTTTTTAGPLSPPFLQPSKMAVRLIIFCVPTICMVGAPTGHYLFLFCNCQKITNRT